MRLEELYIALEAALAGFAVLNSFFWRTLEPRAGVSSQRVSVLIPARNEAQNLERLLPSLLQSADPDLEVLVLDDRSEDATAQVVRRFARADARLKLLEGQPLPDGWLGKNWACDQLGRAARGDLLIFTDADTKWQPGAVAAVAHALQGCDALCAWPAQTVSDPISRLVQPLQQWSLVAFLPIFFVPVRSFPVAVAANGQCLAFSRSIYERVGGHGSVRGEVVEDMALARGVKRGGGRFRLLNGAKLIETRMYQNAPEAFEGYAKNVYPAFGGTPVAFVLATAFNLVMYVLPWLWLLTAWRLEALLAVLLSLVARGLSDFRSGYDPRFTPLHPVAVLVWAYIGGVSMKRFVTGRVTWKGRSYDLRSKHPRG